MTSLEKKSWLNSVPAAAVRRKGQALFDVIWCKGFVGGINVV